MLRGTSGNLLGERRLFHPMSPAFPEVRITVAGFEMLWQSELIVNCQRSFVSDLEKRGVPDGVQKPVPV
jgi:hypothetical protein